MSTAKKRTIKYVSLVASLILVVSYFSLLSPTSAYFYKSETQNAKLTFAMFDVEQTLFENEEKLKFDGATKLCDTEELLFDRVAIEKKITLKNNGDADARIVADITPNDEAVNNGLCYYVEFVEEKVSEPETDAPETVAEGEETTESSTEEVIETTTTSAIKKGDLKEYLESKLNISDSSTHDSVQSALDNHNATVEGSYVIIEPGESATVRIIFWSEYDPVMDNNGNEAGWQNAGGNIKNINYSCNIRIVAAQDRDEAVAEALKEETQPEVTTTEETSIEETTTEETTVQQ
ncbi:MAG: hypothetical protein IJ279_00410 [Clostridia bacterium]|nr:hypothetical protein [Clostridia bacterium]